MRVASRDAARPPNANFIKRSPITSWDSSASIEASFVSFIHFWNMEASLVGCDLTARLELQSRAEILEKRALYGANINATEVAWRVFRKMERWSIQTRCSQRVRLFVRRQELGCR
jgi:hypothetical protein